jgi:hypothetical protein
MLPLPGSPAETRLGGTPAAGGGAGLRPGSRGSGADDSATTRLDVDDLARVRRTRAPSGGTDAGPAGAPNGTPTAPPPAQQAAGASSPVRQGPPPPPPPPAAEPGEEQVDDSTREAVARLDDEVLVIDEEPLFHLGRCRYLYGREVIGLPASEALELGFGGCSWCTPVAALSEQRGADTRR